MHSPSSSATTTTTTSSDSNSNSDNNKKSINDYHIVNGSVYRWSSAGGAGGGGGTTANVNGSVLLFQSRPEGVWQVREDKVTRPGFIHEFPPFPPPQPAASSSASSTTSSSTTPGKAKSASSKGTSSISSSSSSADTSTNAIQSFGDSRAGRLRFYLNKRHQDFRHTELLQISYLRSYVNMGMVRVHFCGHPLQDGRYEQVTLDGLWPDFETFRFSLPEVYTIELDPGRCAAGRRKDHDSEYVTLDFYHERIPQAHMRSQARKDARGTQKFKLLEVKVCAATAD